MPRKYTQIEYRWLSIGATYAHCSERGSNMNGIWANISGDEKNANFRDKSKLRLGQYSKYYVPQMNCASCAWKLEKIAQHIPEVSTFDAQINNKTIELNTVTPQSQTEFIEQAKEAGFLLQELSHDREKNKLEIIENRRKLKHLAVAGFCAGNIMLFSSAHYTGVTDDLALVFSYLSALFTLPALIYSAQDFYRGFWNSLKTRHASIDAPIVVALSLGTLFSGINLFYYNSQEIYFDSIAALIFLLLAGRYVLYRLQAKVFQKNKLELIPEDQKVEVENDGRFNLCTSENLKVNDLVRVHQGQVIPTDGLLLSEDALIDQSILTGESEANHTLMGEKIYGGTKLISDSLEYRVTAEKEESRISKLLAESVKLKLQQSKFVGIIDRFAQRFTLAVLFISIAVLAYWAYSSQTWIGIERSLALLIVACPCALAFGAPLIISLAIKKAESLNIIARSGDVFEKANLIENIICDKTGTLTRARLVVDQASTQLTSEHKSIITYLESKSQHPIAQAIRKFIGPQNIQSFAFEVKEIQGYGVEGTLEGKVYRLSKLEEHQLIENSKTQVGFFINNELNCIFSLSDELRPHAKTLVQSLKSGGKKVLIVSGDHSRAVEATRRELGIDNNNVFANVAPEQKLKIVEQTNGPSMMIGDGVNDAAALAKAHVSVAMAGPIESIINSADIVLIKNELNNLLQFFRLSNQTRKTIIRLGLFSLLYNLTCGALAVLGFMSPLLAAVLMPMSSLLVSAIVIIHLQERQWKL